MRIVGALLITLGVLASLAACQAGPLPPTPTAIPLAATATSSPLRNSPTTGPSEAATGALPTMTPAITKPPTATASASGDYFGLDERLATATVLGFLDHLAAGNARSAFNLYLTDEAKAGELGQMLTQFVEPEAQLQDAKLIELQRTSDTSYRAQAELRWASTEDRGAGIQALTLILEYRRGLWLIDEMDLGTLQASPTPTRRPSASSRSHPPHLDGKLVFQTSSGGDIYTINADGSRLRRLTDGLDPAWSPDGTQIAFTRWRDPWGVYLINQDGSSEQRIVDSTRLKEVAWSPDGSKLAFTIDYGPSEPVERCYFGICFTLPPTSTGQIWLTDLKTGEMLSLPLIDQAVHAPTWSPSGVRVVYAGDQGLGWIDLTDMTTGRFPGSVWDRSPAFSPGGQRIAFMGRVHNRWEIFVSGADGSGRTQLTFGDPELEQPPSSVAPTWSPDGKHIAFLSNRDGHWRIYVMNADGSDQRSMFGDSLDDLGFRYEWASERALSWSR